MNKLSTIDCAHFGPCSGCTLSKGVDHPPIWDAMQKYFSFPALELGAICGWRTKAKLAVRGTAEKPVIGLFRAGTHEAMEIPYCQVHHPAINRAVAVLVSAIREERISPYDEKRGLLRYIQCLVDLKTDKIQLVLVWNAPEQAPVMLQLVNRLRETDLWHSIWFNFQPAVTNRIFGDAWQYCFGEPFLYQELGPLRIPFHPASFSQAHWTLFERLAADIVKWVPPQSRLLEIYSGVGALGLLAAPSCRSVDLIESNPFAQLSFEAIKAPPNVRFHCLDAKGAIPLLDQSSCIIVDPPRKGIDRTLLDDLKSWRGSLIYVSCEFESFRRDVDQLLEAGWVLKEAKGYLLFPGTDHVEITALLERSF